MLHSNFRSLFVGILLLALLVNCSSTSARPAGPIHLVILHTNDVHGQVLERKATWIDSKNPPPIGGLPRLAAAIRREKRAAESEGAAVIVVDAGDWYQGTPEGALDHGLPFVSALASIGFDAMSLGNHDFDHGIANLQRVLDGAHVPAICSNLHESPSHARLAWAKPWLIVKRAGLSIALVGLLTTSTPEITTADLSSVEFESPSRAVDDAEHELGQSCDLLIPVGHIGVDESVNLARAHPELPLIVSGHSHTTLKTGQREGNTLIVQTGAKATALGRVDLIFDPATKSITSIQAKLIDLLDAPAAEDRDAVVDASCAKIADSAKADMGTVVGELAAPLERAKSFGSSTAGNWTTDLMRERTKADVALHNKGGIRSDIRAGKVTRRDLFEIAPFDNDLVTVDVTGELLESIVRRGLEGSTHTGMEFSGLVAFVSKDEKEKLHLERVEVGGKPLDRTRIYRLVTNSFLADGGDGLSELKSATGRREDPMLLRDLYEWGMQGHGPITPPSDARVVVIAAAAKR